MKKLTDLMIKLRGLSNAITRFPLTVLFFLIASVLFSIGINGEESYEIQIITCIVGAVLSGCLQVIYERFFIKNIHRIILLGCGIIVTTIYYFIVKNNQNISIEIGIRTPVALLAVMLGFQWIPTIRSKFTFNQSFMVNFKAFFQSIFYGGVIFVGCSLIIGAIDLLIISIESKAYLHILNVVFILFVPVFYFSLIPVYPGKIVGQIDSEENQRQSEVVTKAAYCPKFLDGLISYIFIPLTMVYTVILILYILLNIPKDFWTNNLLEPLLISYAIIGIILYILSSNLQNKFAVLFRGIFPKILVPIILFQITSTFLSLGDTGITHFRYFVILFGIYSALAGIVMCFVPVRKNGILAAMLIVFSIISITPPIDAFTVSKLSQTNMLKSVLIKNDMIENNTIIPKELISDEDKKKIYLAVEYLEMMQYTEKIRWMPQDFDYYQDFKDTFGFQQYELSENFSKYSNVYLNSSEPIDIAGYDIFVHTSVTNNDTKQQEICNLEKSGHNYILTRERIEEQNVIVLRDNNEEKVIEFNIAEIFSRYHNYAIDKSEIEMEEALFVVENDRAKIAIVVQNANMENSLEQTYNYADVFILVGIE